MAFNKLGKISSTRSQTWLLRGVTDGDGNLRRIFRRCLECPDTIPSCPEKCASDEMCSLKARTCDECASMVCTKVQALPGQIQAKPSTPTGAIVGGVIGGVVTIILFTYLVWRFCIRNKRREWEKQRLSDAEVEKRDQSQLHPDERRSNVGSIASTVLTRASNVIQIAYIPGVTNRSEPNSPAFAPPVPPIPIATTSTTPASTPGFDQDRFLFMPHDLRDSTFTEDDRSSISPSLARESIATTIFRNAIVNPIPAQQATRVKPSVVSLGTLGTPGQQPAAASIAPPAGVARNMGSTKSSIVARNVQARPIEVKKAGSGAKIPTLANLKAQEIKRATRQASNTSLSKTLSEKKGDSSSDDGSDQASDTISPIIKPRSPHITSLAVTPETRSPATPATRKNDSISMKSLGSSSALSPATRKSLDEIHEMPTHRHSRSQGGSDLDAMIEDAIEHATHTGRSSPPELDSRSLKHSIHSNKDAGGPFSDANEVKED